MEREENSSATCHATVLVHLEANHHNLDGCWISELHFSLNQPPVTSNICSTASYWFSVRHKDKGKGTPLPSSIRALSQIHQGLALSTFLLSWNHRPLYILPDTATLVVRPQCWHLWGTSIQNTSASNWQVGAYPGLFPLPQTLLTTCPCILLPSDLKPLLLCVVRYKPLCKRDANRLSDMLCRSLSSGLAGSTFWWQAHSPCFLWIPSWKPRARCLYFITVFFSPSIILHGGKHAIFMLPLLWPIFIVC